MRADAAGREGARAGRKTADLPRIGLMTLAHGINDSYGNVLTVLMPVLAAPEHLDFSLALASGVITANTITSSILQPLLGYWADRWATRLISVVGLLLSAVGASLLGVAPHELVLIALAVVGGVGTAAYHPQAAAMVVAVAGERRATVMSLYLMGGNVGFALGPLLVTQLVAVAGLGATPLAMMPGLVGCLLLERLAPRNWSPRTPGSGPTLRAILRRNRAVLARLLAVVTARSWAHYTLLAFLPFYLRDRGVDEGARAALIALLTFAGAFGGVIGGYVADRWTGRRTVIVGSLLLASFCAGALLHTDGALRWVWAALTGMTLLGSFSVLTVKGQEILPGNVGLASGLMLGLTIGLGGLFVLPMGAVADRLGLTPVIHLAVVLPPVAALLARALPE
jgi:FSR family fosmidomycin resistance protein-like MFS transporter